MASLQSRRFDDAKQDFNKFLKVQPRHFGALNLVAVVSMQLGEFKEAAEYLRRAIAIDAHSDATHYNFGMALTALGSPSDALAAFSTALTINPRAPETWNSRGAALSQLERHVEALADFDKAISLRSDFAEAFYNKGKSLALCRRSDDALAAFDAALRIKSDLAEAWIGRGNTLAEQERDGEALDAFQTALRIKPALADAWLGCGNVFARTWRFDEAAAAYQAALNAAPGLKFGRGYLLYAKSNACDWDGLAAGWSAVIADARRGVLASLPFPLLATAMSAADQLSYAKVYAADRFRNSADAAPRAARPPSDRIRLAYLSADFREHATAQLMAGVFEHHDRTRFETIAVSYGADDGSAMRARLTGAFDRFVDIRQTSDQDAAALLRELNVDIAVDLKGYTDRNRLDILATRPAPLQVSYLGYPGTTGASFIDYIVADKFLIPEADRPFYSETIVYLPDSYQCNDATRRIAETQPTRAEAGLPADGFVFCSFNNSYKITPEIFDVWTLLLRDVEGSVLWLLESNALCVGHLKREAEKRGIAPERLVFAPRVALADHLARHRLADLFLDTPNYNAHTTASDALWCGLPVLTCAGATFAGRVAGSLLSAIGLPELITTSLDDYERLALRIARDPALAASLRAKLAQNRMTFPLFDTSRFTRHLEAAYVHMWERHQRGEPPADIAVAPVSG
jgi:protein O-GlcNAc transferase